MSLNQKDQHIENALIRVNQAREALGLPTLVEMPDGQPEAGHDCPVYHALRNGHDLFVGVDVTFFNSREAGTAVADAWGTEVVAGAPNLSAAELLTEHVTFEELHALQKEITTKWVAVRNPVEVTQFVSAFDNGDFLTEEGLLN